MKNFEGRKMEYFQRLKKYSEFILDLTKEQKNEKIVEVLLNPKKWKRIRIWKLLSYVYWGNTATYC